MIQQQMDHQTATGWVASEINMFEKTVGQPNASCAARSVNTLALLLRVISLEEHNYFLAHIERIANQYNTQFLAACREKMTNISAPHQTL
ncbi:hypothetical protein SJI00_07240 [Pseudomonas sp. RP23018S]|uniref:hypothetical protein n=1 Tax=Pseudomonas sp. RP23018S TaxID=3096037 RepID=UPI002ACA4424|nr:hypothetical protein [Pseudomonas sp. RP23018S]MDZ5602564.1 hypothetical protein [Pseudomonas sp. RP23018S]